MTIDQQLEFLRRGTTEIISEAELKAKLELGRPLRVKLGVDPTARDVTLGWAVVLRKLRDFQSLGHQAVLVVGDFTAMIGDPSGKNKTRKQLTAEEVQVNVDAVKQQFGKILDIEKTEIRLNSEWLAPMNFADVLRLCGKTTVARIMERDDFTKRWEAHQPIAMHELMYPLLQGTDSVALEADIELGGNDQKFNNLMGRQLQEASGQAPQVVVLSPLLVGTDGKDKMSQSLGNYVSIIDTPNDMFGKTMSIPDDLIKNWFELCTDVQMDEVAEMMAGISDGSINPRDVKMRLAREIVGLYHPGAVTPAWVQSFSDEEENLEEVEEEEEEEQSGDVKNGPGLSSTSKLSGELASTGNLPPVPVLTSQYLQPYKVESIFTVALKMASQETAATLRHFWPSTSPITTLTSSASGFALEAEANFIRTYSERKEPVTAEEATIPSELGDPVLLAALIATLGMARSNGAARDLIQAGAVSLDGEKVTDLTVRLPVVGLRGKLLKVGKHQFRKLK
jgi:tyrosyl-tRNA synthetase